MAGGREPGCIAEVTNSPHCVQPANRARTGHTMRPIGPPHADGENVLVDVRHWVRSQVRYLRLYGFLFDAQSHEACLLRLASRRDHASRSHEPRCFVGVGYAQTLLRQVSQTVPLSCPSVRQCDRTSSAGATPALPGYFAVVSLVRNQTRRLPVLLSPVRSKCLQTKLRPQKMAHPFPRIPAAVPVAGCDCSSPG
jgi:hypothetical protein